jgi:hypothetical protein
MKITYEIKWVMVNTIAKREHKKMFETKEQALSFYKDTKDFYDGIDWFLVETIYDGFGELFATLEQRLK